MMNSTVLVGSQACPVSGKAIAAAASAAPSVRLLILSMTPPLSVDRSPGAPSTAAQPARLSFLLQSAGLDYGQDSGG
jgi:hypothetical protein